MRASHSSSSSGGRAFSDGNEPTTPALHCAITRSGTEMMKSGEPITGIDRRPLNKEGMDIARRSSAGGHIEVGSHTSKAIFPLSSIAFWRRGGRRYRNSNARNSARTATSRKQIRIDQPLEREHLVPFLLGQ